MSFLFFVFCHITVFLVVSFSTIKDISRLVLFSFSGIMAASSPPFLSPSQIQRYEEDGVICLRSFFDPEEMEEIRKGVERNMRNPSVYASENGINEGDREKEGRFFDDYCNWERIPEFQKIIFSPKVGETAAQVMKSSTCQFFHDHVLVKEPYTKKESVWHMDLPYYFLEGQKTMSMWIPLEEVWEGANTLQFLKGSHKWGRMIRPVSWTDNSDFYKMEEKEKEKNQINETNQTNETNEKIRGRKTQTAATDIALAQLKRELQQDRLERLPQKRKHSIVEYSMKPGDVVLFNFKTAHGARGNLNPTRRRVLSLRFMGDDVHYTLRPGKTSPPFPGHNMKEGQKPLREDWFPILYPYLSTTARAVTVENNSSNNNNSDISCIQTENSGDNSNRNQKENESIMIIQEKDNLLSSQARSTRLFSERNTEQLQVDSTDHIKASNDKSISISSPKEKQKLEDLKIESETHLKLSQIINFQKYPWLKNMASREAQEVLEKARKDFKELGIFTLPNFITDVALEEIQRETISKATTAFECNSKHNIYLKPEIDTNHSLSHIRNRQYPTRVASIAFDELDPKQALVNLYESDLLPTLIAHVTNQKKCYHSADILGRCSVNVFKNGWKHAWHFDESEYSTTLMIQKPEAGGIFQYTAPLRSHGDELVEDLVESAMDDLTQESEERRRCNNNENNDKDKNKSNKNNNKNSKSVTLPALSKLLPEEEVQKEDKTPNTFVRRKNLKFEEGTLSIFSGRRSLHRVTNCSGNLHRLVAVFTFASEKGYQNSETVRTLFWGRTGEENKERKRKRRGGGL